MELQIAWLTIVVIAGFMGINYWLVKILEELRK